MRLSRNDLCTSVIWKQLYILSQQGTFFDSYAFNGSERMDILMWIVKPFIFFTLGHHYNGTSGQEIVLLYQLYV